MGVHDAQEKADSITEKMHLTGGQLPPEMNVLSPEMKHDVADAVHDKLLDAQDEEHQAEEDLDKMATGSTKVTQARKVEETRARERELKQQEEALWKATPPDSTVY